MKKKEINGFQAQLTAWYDTHHRDLPWRKSGNPYYIWVSEVMLQQTQVDTVIPYFFRFIKRFEDVKSLAEADLQDVLKLWQGLGYYARARNFHKAANLVMHAHNGRIPDDPEVFRTLPGVGDYISSAVQSIAFDHPMAVVDGNVKRVLARVFELDTPVNNGSSHKKFKVIADDLLDTADPGRFNQAMMELGALICKPKQPLCHECPVSRFCLAAAHETVHLFPRRVAKTKTPLHHLVAGVVIKNKKLLIVRRPVQGLLGGMWEFPSGRADQGKTPAAACVANLLEMTNLNVSAMSKLTRVTHAYTHFRIKLDVFLCDYISGRVTLNGPDDFRWIAPHELDKFPVHKANLKFIPALLDHICN